MFFFVDMARCREAYILPAYHNGAESLTKQQLIEIAFK